MHRDSRKEGLKEGWKGTRTRLWDALLSPWQQADKACGCCSMKSKSDAPNFRQFYKININTLCGIIKYVDTPFRLVERWWTTWEGNNNYYYSQFFLLKRERREAGGHVVSAVEVFWSLTRSLCSVQTAALWHTLCLHAACQGHQLLC